jgi:hypothetical protein
MITEKAFNDSATLLGVEPATIKAVAEVESSGDGFLPSGHPKILFEPHKFWQQLKARGIDPTKITGASDILYKDWGSKPYGKNSAQPERLERAIKINKDAALSSASWGKFQIMGFNYELAGFATLDAFVAAMHIDEDQHLFAFINFVKSKNLVDELQRKHWAGFAKVYNGSGYKANKYDEKLAAAYNKFKASL